MKTEPGISHVKMEVDVPDEHSPTTEISQISVDESSHSPLQNGRSTSTECSHGYHAASSQRSQLEKSQSKTSFGNSLLVPTGVGYSQSYSVNQPVCPSKGKPHGQTTNNFQSPESLVVDKFDRQHTAQSPVINDSQISQAETGSDRHSARNSSGLSTEISRNLALDLSHSSPNSNSRASPNGNSPSSSQSSQSNPTENNRHSPENVQVTPPAKSSSGSDSPTDPESAYAEICHLIHTRASMILRYIDFDLLRRDVVRRRNPQHTPRRRHASVSRVRRVPNAAGMRPFIIHYMRSVEISILIEKTKRGNPDEDVFKKGTNQRCLVCSELSTGLHYGKVTCEGCKGFFKRVVQGRQLFECVGYPPDQCDISSKERRNVCKKCRFRKCLLVGMSPAAVRENHMPGGRNSQAVYDYEYLLKADDEMDVQESNGNNVTNNTNGTNNSNGTNNNGTNSYESSTIVPMDVTRPTSQSFSAGTNPMMLNLNLIPPHLLAPLGASPHSIAHPSLFIPPVTNFNNAHIFPTPPVAAMSEKQVLEFVKQISRYPVPTISHPMVSYHDSEMPQTSSMPTDAETRNAATTEANAAIVNASIFNSAFVIADKANNSVENEETIDVTLPAADAMSSHNRETEQHFIPRVSQSDSELPNYSPRPRSSSDSKADSSSGVTSVSPKSDSPRSHSCKHPKKMYLERIKMSLDY